MQPVTGWRTSNMTLLGDGRIMNGIHDRRACEGRGCWVHHPTRECALREAPVYWDEYGRRAYRLCEHGVLHCDIDDYDYAMRYSTRYVGTPRWCCPQPDDCRCCTFIFPEDSDGPEAVG